MLKQPRAGRVKTRLGRDIGLVPAAWWFRHQSAALLRRLSDPRWDILLAIAPDTSLSTRAFAAHLPRLGQGRGDLGARMARLLRHPHGGPVCLVGGDIPGLQPAHVARAFACLGRVPFVFGPACDGGFWLAGLRHPSLCPSTLFQQVRWSTPHALADSIASLGGRPCVLTDRLADVDTAADLARAAPASRAIGTCGTPC